MERLLIFMERLLMTKKHNPNLPATYRLAIHQLLKSMNPCLVMNEWHQGCRTAPDRNVSMNFSSASSMASLGMSKPTLRASMMGRV